MAVEHKTSHATGGKAEEKASSTPSPPAPSSLSNPSDDVIAATERHQSFRLFIVLLLIGSFFFVELIGAKIARSDVLEADAFHLLMDVFALAISLSAMRMASRRPSERFTFGLRRTEPIAALTNGVLVLGVAIELTRDAIQHLGGGGEPPRSGMILIVATAALCVNGISAWLLHGAMGGHGHHGHSHGHSHGPAKEKPAHDHDHDHDHKHDHDHEHDHDHGHAHGHDPKAHADPKAHTDEHDHDHEAHGHVAHGQQLNLRGVWLHLLGDILGSLAAFGAGLAIRLGAPPIVDPLASFIVVAILIVGSLRLLRDAGLVLLEAAPGHLSIAKVKKTLLGIEGVEKVAALHVWSLGTGHDAITAHVESKSKDPKLGARACEIVRKKFTVEYVTVQVDVSDD